MYYEYVKCIRWCWGTDYWVKCSEEREKGPLLEHIQNENLYWLHLCKEGTTFLASDSILKRKIKHHLIQKREGLIGLHISMFDWIIMNTDRKQHKKIIPFILSADSVII